MRSVIRALAVLLLSAAPALAQERAVLQERPLATDPSRVVIVSRLTLPPGARIPLHTHSGDEHAVILTQGTALMPTGQTLQIVPDMTMYFPEGMVHGGVTNTGDMPIQILTTHILRAGAPFQTPAE